MSLAYYRTMICIGVSLDTVPVIMYCTNMLVSIQDVLTSYPHNTNYYFSSPKFDTITGLGC